jgi:hypothetical protein
MRLSVSCSCWRSSSATCASIEPISPPTACLRFSAAREVLIARAQRLARLPIELDDLLTQAVLVACSRLGELATSLIPCLTFAISSSCFS